MTGGNASEFFIKSLEENMPELKVTCHAALTGVKKVQRPTSRSSIRIKNSLQA